jgi:hypothetical protein
MVPSERGTNILRNKEREISNAVELADPNAMAATPVAVRLVDEPTGLPRVDPLLRDVPLPLRAMFYPMGFSVEVVTNSVEVLAAAEESWGHCRKVFSERTVELRFGVIEDGSQKCPPEAIYRARRNLRTMVADQNNSCTCDLKEGFAFAWLTRAAVEDHIYFRYYFLEPAAAFFVIDSPRVTLVHAACVKMSGRGVLLCGDSGAGKSSLAFACALAGWTYLSDDVACLVEGGKDRIVVGNPHMFRFRDSAVQLFPELQGETIAPRAAGKPTIEFPSVRIPEITTADRCSVDYIVFLNREEPDPPGLVPFPRDIALQWFEQEFSADDLREARLAAIRNLLTVEILELHYRDLDFAVGELEKLIEKDIWKNL